MSTRIRTPFDQHPGDLAVTLASMVRDRVVAAAVLTGCGDPARPPG